MPNCTVCGKELTAFNRAYGSGSGKCAECATGESPTAKLQAAFREFDAVPELQEGDIRGERLISALPGLFAGGLFVFGATYLAGSLAPGVGTASLAGCLIAVWLVGFAYAGRNPLHSLRWARFWHGSVLGYYVSMIVFWLLWQNKYLPFNSPFLLDAFVGIAVGLFNVCVNDQKDKNALVDLHSAWRLSLDEEGIPIEQTAICGSNSIEYEVPIFNFVPRIHHHLRAMVAQKADALVIVTSASPALELSNELCPIDYPQISETDLVRIIESLAPKQIEISSNRLPLPLEFLFAASSHVSAEQSPNRYVLFRAEASRTGEGNLLARFSIGKPHDASCDCATTKQPGLSSCPTTTPLNQPSTAATAASSIPVPDIEHRVEGSDSLDADIRSALPVRVSAPKASVEQRLLQLNDLKAKGLIDADEIAAKRKEILDEL